MCSDRCCELSITGVEEGDNTESGEKTDAACHFSMLCALSWSRAKLTQSAPYAIKSLDDIHMRHFITEVAEKNCVSIL
jgi:hypothetical protein